MDATLVTDYGYRLELMPAPDGSGPPLFSRDVSAEVADLVEEALVASVLSEDVARDERAIRAEVRPVWSEPPWVAELEVRLEVERNGAAQVHSLRFGSEAWRRRALEETALLRQRGAVSQGAKVYRGLVAQRRAGGPAACALAVDAPLVADVTLEQAGVRSLFAGSLLPERPVLVNRRLVEEVLAWTVQAGKVETGGAVLGRLARLPAPLPGARTRIVTVLSAVLRDSRHAGKAAHFDFSPEALAEAAQVAELRGLGEAVITAFHSHGWQGKCADCAGGGGSDCSLPECEPSLQDYVLLESLFPGRAALLPIAGRRPAAAGQRLAFEVFAWRSGALCAIPWQLYTD